MPAQRQNHPQRKAAAIHNDWRVWFMGSLLLMLSLLIVSSAQAQTFTPVIVSGETPHTPLGTYTIIRPDPQETISEARIRQTKGAVLSGKIGEKDIVYLGQDGTPYWLAFKILNNGKADNWLLNTGHRLDGRIGYVTDISAYEMPLAMPGSSQKPEFYLREIKSHKGSGFYKIAMPENSQKLIVLHVRPVAGMPTTLPLSLASGASFVGHIEYKSSFNAIYTMALIAFAAFFGATGIARRNIVGKSFAVYFIFIAACYILYEHLGSIRSIGLFKEMTMVVSFVYTCVIIWTTRTFCRTDLRGYTERYILHAILWLSGAAMFVSFFLPAGDGSLHVSILYGMPLSGISLAAMMSFAQSYTGKINGYALCVNWLVSGAGLLVTALASRESIPLNAFTLTAMWLVVIPQGILMIMAYLQQQEYSIQDQTIGHGDSEKLNLSKLKQTKDEADHSRLLKVIEKEREMLAELRHKETIRMDEMRKAKEAADEANRAKSAFLAVVSHEIRTPMTGIMGMVRLLLDSNITKQQKDYVMTIQDSGDAMLALLNDILDFEKIQRGKMELENISFDLHRLIQGVVTLMSGHAEHKSIPLNVEVGSDIPRFVKGDPTRLRQILLNLMGNAIKFTENGGVTLHVKNMDAGNSTQGNIHTIYFAVQDTGIGIPADAQKKLFTPFAQADSTISRKFGGTGLGLAISKGLVEAMGAEVNINSQEGEGSTFFFTLKMEKGLSIAQEPARHAPTKSQNSARPDPKHILVVDDNAINQKVISNFLEQDHHSIVLSGSAEDALSKFEQQDFDIVLMDIELPGMSGNEATKIIRSLKNPIKSAVPVIAITGNVDSEHTDVYLADGMSGTIAKPIDADLLKSIVRDMAGKPHVQKSAKVESISSPQIQPAKPASELTLEQPVTLELADQESYVPAPPPPRPEKNAEDAIVFNTDMLQTLKDAIGADQLKQLLDELIVKTDEIITAMDQAIKTEDLEALYSRSHELKGMAGNFGLLEISGIAALTEEKAKAHQIDGLGELINTLPDAYTRARDALKAWSTAA